MRHQLLAALSGLMVVSMILSASGPAATPAPPTAAPTQPPAQPTKPPEPTKPPAPTNTPAPTPTPKPKVVRVTISQEPDSLNPLYTQMWFSAIVLQTYLATGLLVYNDKNEPIPWVRKLQWVYRPIMPAPASAIASRTCSIADSGTKTTILTSGSDLRVVSGSQPTTPSFDASTSFTPPGTVS